MPGKMEPLISDECLSACNEYLRGLASLPVESWANMLTGHLKPPSKWEHDAAFRKLAAETVQEALEDVIDDWD